MIADRISNWRLYGFGGALASAFEFVEKLGPDAADKEYHLKGKELYAAVSQYETLGDNSAVLETHRKYVDIQLTLSGREIVGWLPLDGLPLKTPYDPVKDVEFHSHPDKPFSRIELYPGMFVIFFPQDAHMGKLVAGKHPELVKKVVIKASCDLIASGD